MSILIRFSDGSELIVNNVSRTETSTDNKLIFFRDTTGFIAVTAVLANVNFMEMLES